MADSLTYVKGNNLQEVLKSIDDNFAKTVNSDLYKGDKGDNVKTEEKSLKTDGKLTDTGKEVYETIFGDGAAITDDRLKDFPETWSLYPAMPLFFAHHEGERGTFIDYSCMVVATEVENVYTYEKHEVFPTIYYNSATGNYCWKLNGVETSIPTYKTPSEGNNVQLFLIKDVVDNNNSTKLEYWDPVNGAWTDSAPKDLVASDLAYKLGSTTAEVGDSTETVATVELYTYNGSEWVAVYYDEKAAVLIEYDNARMSYIWKTIYDNLGQNYTTDLVAANSFKFPDGDTAGHYISAVNNESQTDIMVQYKNGTKSHAIVLDGYEVYTGMPTIKDNAVTHNAASRLIHKEELYKQVPIGQIYSNGLSSMVSKTGFVCIDRGARSSNYVRYIYIYDAPQDKCSALNTWVGIGLDQSTSETFEVRYTIDATKSTDQILWMRDKWGNECDYDFIETPTFCVEKNDDRSKGWYKNNKVTRVPVGSTFMFNLYDMEAGIDETVEGEYSAELINICVENNEIYGSYGYINIKKNTTRQGASSLNFKDVIVTNNVVSDSNVNITAGGPFYNAFDSFVTLSDVYMQRNVIKNSAITIGFTKSLLDCNIIYSTINNIYTLWAATNKKSFDSASAISLINYTSPSFESYKNQAKNRTYVYNMVVIARCNFYNCVFDYDAEVAFMLSDEKSKAGEIDILKQCQLLDITFDSLHIFNEDAGSFSYNSYGIINILGFLGGSTYDYEFSEYDWFTEIDTLDNKDSSLQPYGYYLKIDKRSFPIIVGNVQQTEKYSVTIYSSASESLYITVNCINTTKNGCLNKHNLYKLVTTTVPALLSNVSTLRSNVSVLQKYHTS